MDELLLVLVVYTDSHDQLKVTKTGKRKNASNAAFLMLNGQISVKVKYNNTGTTPTDATHQRLRQ